MSFKAPDRTSLSFTGNAPGFFGISMLCPSKAGWDSPPSSRVSKAVSAGDATSPLGIDATAAGGDSSAGRACVSRTSTVPSVGRDADVVDSLAAASKRLPNSFWRSSDGYCMTWLRIWSSVTGSASSGDSGSWPTGRAGIDEESGPADPSWFVTVHADSGVQSFVRGPDSM